jgi:hypothetical protein
MKKTTQQIEFISASNKLKNINSNEGKDKEKKEKITYADRKKLGIYKCLELLNNNGNNISWIDYFKNHKKYDDLSDAFLQGLWYINKS